MKFELIIYFAPIVPNGSHVLREIKYYHFRTETAFPPRTFQHLSDFDPYDPITPSALFE